MRAVANDAQRSLVALLFAVELATLLGRHDDVLKYVDGGASLVKSLARDVCEFPE